MSACKDTQKFKTSEASTKAWLRTRGIVDRYLNILDLNRFRINVTNLSKDANEKFGITQRLFTEEDNGRKAVPNKEAFKAIDNAKGVYYQGQSSESSKASSQVMKLTKDFLNRIGVDMKEVNKINVNGELLDDNGVAQITEKIVQVVNGKQDVALTEEAMHFAVEIMAQTNPALFNQLLKEINGYQMYGAVLNNYSNNPLYQIDGKPNILKLKKEAIAKVLTEKIINKVEGTTEKPELLNRVTSWWEKIIDSFKSLFVKSGFDRAAMSVISGEFEGTAEDARVEEGEAYLQQGPGSKQSKMVENIRDIHSRLTKGDVTEDNKSKQKYFFDGSDTPIKTRVSDVVERFYKNLFGDNEINETEFEKAVMDTYAEKGTDGHADQEHILSLFTDENGFALKNDKGEFVEKDDTGYKPVIGNVGFYKILKDNMRTRIQMLENKNPGSVYLAEMQIYDKKYDKAGTIDLMAITPEGKVSIYDWKFINLNTEKYEDVPWYKVKAWNLQMSQYKMMLQNSYGLTPESFLQTQMIPIIAEYSKPNRKTNALPVLLGIRIGDVNAKNIATNEAYLLPVGLPSDRTDNNELNKVLKKLNSLYDKLSISKVITPEDKIAKAEQLNALYDAIRQLKMRENVEPLIEQFRTLNKRIDNLVDFYKQTFVGIDPKLLTDTQIDNFSKDLNSYAVTLQYTYSSLDIDLDSLFEGIELTEKDKEMQLELAKAASDAKKLGKRLDNISESFVKDVIAKREDMNNFLSPEKIIRGVPKMFSTTATLQTNALQWLYLKANKQLYYSGVDTLAETKVIQDLQKAYTTWAYAKGMTDKNMFDMIMKKDKNVLIDQYNSTFYKTLRSKINQQDHEWIIQNIDVAKFKADIQEELQRELDYIASKPRPRGPDHVSSKAEIVKESNKVRKKYDVSSPEGAGWSQYRFLKKHPLASKWESSEWTELNKPENAPAKDFYDYIIKRNEYYKSIGYIQGDAVRNFLPFVKKGWIEKLVLGGDITIGEQFLRNITVEEGDIGYGDRDAETGQLVNKVPKYFSRDTGQEMSTDLFRTMALMNDMAIKYDYINQIEHQAVLIGRVERNKEAIETSFFGNTRLDEEGELKTVNDNSENYKLYESHLNAIIYQHKYLENTNFDTILGKIGGFGETLNDKLGVKIFPTTLKGRQVSFNKMLDWVSTTFVMKTLGFNPLSSFATLLGGSFQSVINAGKYYTKTDFIASEALLASMMYGVDAKKYIGAIEYFLPLTEDYNKEVAKKLSLNKFSQENMQELLMSWMRNADKIVQLTNFFSYLKNTAVVDGNVVNARVYVRSQEKYDNMYSAGPTEQERLEKEFEQEVADLLKTSSVLQLAEVEGGTFTIPGVTQKSDSVVEVRRNVQQLTKDALGSLSPDDVRSINFTIQGKSFMMFKGWIPRLVDVRLGGLKYNAGYKAYEWGRSRMVGEMLYNDLSRSINSLLSYATGKGNAKWIDQIKDEFERKRADYKKETGKTLQMTEREFVDLANQNLRNQLVDIMFYLTLTGIYFAMHSMEPGEDEADREVRNRYKYLMRMVDKVRDEIAYFYDPTQLISLTTAGIFPALGYLNTLKKALFNSLNELYAIGIGDVKEQEKNKVVKYYMKSFPIISQLDAPMLMFFPDMAKDLGFKAQSEARPMGQ